MVPIVVMTRMRTPRRGDLLVRGTDGWELQLEENMRREDRSAAAADSKTTHSPTQCRQCEPQVPGDLLGLMDEAVISSKRSFWKN
jgi:hypothetical protein